MLPDDLRDGAVTLLSVRGEADRVVAPDQATLHATVNCVADSNGAAMSAVAGVVSELVTALAALGGVALTVDTTRAALTWSTRSMRSHAEFEHDKRTGQGGPTGRHRAAATVLVGVREFSLLDEVGTVTSAHDEVDVHSVQWSVDDDNAGWRPVRAAAIRAALRKAHDYAVALGGSVVRVEHVADAGLLGGEALLRGGPIHATSAVRAAGAEGHGSISLEPPPQVLSATIDARIAAAIPQASATAENSD